jgi:hypothetical protein
MDNNELSRAERKRRRENADAFEVQKRIRERPIPRPSTSDYVEVESPPYIPPKISVREKKRLEALAVETEKLKKAMVVQLRKTPIVQIACERTGVGRSTYYKWRTNDHIFGRAADRALEAGKFFINDLAKSKLLQLIQDGDKVAIIFWLKHNDPTFVAVSRVIHEYETATIKPSVEENSIAALKIAEMMADKLTPRYTAEEMKEKIEDEERESKANKESNDRLRSFEEDEAKDK